jgi:hypothetical protein
MENGASVMSDQTVYIERSSPKTIEHVAYHEAGHATVAIVLGVPLRLVTIRPSDGALGRTFVGGFPGWYDPENEHDEVTLMITRSHVLTSLAGGVAERRHSGVLDDTAMSEDRAFVIDFVTKFDGGEDQSAEDLWADTEALVEESWPAIDALAQVLLRKRTVWSNEAKTLVRAALTVPMISAVDERTSKYRHLCTKKSRERRLEVIAERIRIIDAEAGAAQLSID